MGLLKRAEHCRLEIVDERDVRYPASNQITDNDGRKELKNEKTSQVMKSVDVGGLDVLGNEGEIDSISANSSKNIITEFNRDICSPSFSKEFKKSNQKRKSQRVVLGIQSSEATECNVRLKESGRGTLRSDATSIKPSLPSDIRKKGFRDSESGKISQDCQINEKILAQTVKKSRSATGILAKHTQAQKCPVVDLEVCYYANCHHWHIDHCTHPGSLTKI